MNGLIMRSRKIRTFLKKNENEQNSPKFMGHSEGSPEKEVHSDTILPKKDTNISNKQPNPKSTRTIRKTTKPRESRRKEIKKIRG